MKTRTFLKCLTVAAGLLCATTFQVAAQPGGGGGGGGRGFRGGALTPEQMQQIREATQGDAQMTALREKLTAAQKEAVDAALAKDATDENVKAKLEAVAKIQTDIAMLQFTKAVKPMAASVTDEQKTQINDTTAAFTYNQLFGGGFGGRGGRRGGGGGGGGGGGN